MIVNNGWSDVTNNDDGRNHYLLETDQLIDNLDGYQFIGQYQGHSYFISYTQVALWTIARDRAYTDGGYLMCINSQDESNFLNSAFPGGVAFIGLYQDVNDPNYSEPDGGWKWVNGNSGTAGDADFTLSSSTITIPAGQTTGTTTVTAVQDVL